MKKNIILLSVSISLILFSSCKNVKIEDDYYYEETEIIDGMKITLKGKGYGVYGQLIQNYKTGSIQGLMNGESLKIRTGSTDDNNASANEIFLTFEKDGLIETFETEVDVLKIEGLGMVRVYYTDAENKEYTLYSVSSSSETSPYKPAVKVDVNKEVKAITLHIKGNKFYPTSYSSVSFKEDLTQDDFEELKGRQVNNEFSISYVKIQ